jgi:hypothetical protein
MSLNQSFNSSPNVKYSFNVGALLDIPTGDYIRGKYGESILNGGLGFLTGVVGIGNSFKSTILHYLVLSAMDRIMYSVDSSLGTYDTEININEMRLKQFLTHFPNLKDRDIIDSGIWSITDKTVYYANEWYLRLKEFLLEKQKNAKNFMAETPFLDRDKASLVKILIPTFSEIDSFSEFETADIAEIQNSNQLGESGGNTLHMRLGLAKTRFLMELPTLAGRSSHYLLLTAHLGKEINMASGPFSAPPPKKLSYLKNGDKIKGVTDKFFFLMTNVWSAYNSAPMINQTTKGAEYPTSSDNSKMETQDLHAVHLRQLRSKNGPTGIVVEILVSQRDGVLPSLTEFHYIKSNDRFGLNGGAIHYALDLLPAVSLSRTTVRDKIDQDPQLCRALNITAELCQMKHLWRTLDDDLMCTPLELYNDLKAMGYDWNVLLNTRGWWTFNNDKHPIPFLSTMDLLRMRKGLYVPYWLSDDISKPKNNLIKSKGTK